MCTEPPLHQKSLCTAARNHGRTTSASTITFVSRPHGWFLGVTLRLRLCCARVTVTVGDSGAGVHSFTVKFIHKGQDNRTNIPKRDRRLRSELTKHPLTVHTHGKWTPRRWTAQRGGGHRLRRRGGLCKSSSVHARRRGGLCSSSSNPTQDRDLWQPAWSARSQTFEPAAYEEVAIAAK